MDRWIASRFEPRRAGTHDQRTVEAEIAHQQQSIQWKLGRLKAAREESVMAERTREALDSHAKEQLLAGYQARHFGYTAKARVASITLDRPERKNPLTF